MMLSCASSPATSVASLTAALATRNLTQHVVYHSSDVVIVAVPHLDGDKSRIDAVGVGTVTISAVDPTSGITSSTGGGAAAVTVTAFGPTR
jgi:uncharacterized protein YjdB